MNKFDALFEDEDDIFGGSPKSKYWDISNQISKDLMQAEFDDVIMRLAVMEKMLMKIHDEEKLDNIIKNYYYENMDEIDVLKKSMYMELAGKLIYRLAD
ncbi:MAG: DUF2018 family protein [Sulfuricurvum sp.]|jgi:hypothetical protein|nr:DUF2018 family protein [Sulfuricurvum sp.]